ncbi:MAG: class I SAM-dependent methyltransferase [candidate division KSB1 bacterium]|nr:class I SAM-dependent methyltransferase [candidate division KSB1 bacterium]MDZ7275879.1 class I SAM-dependent methyltransferase [candidate division KSB1 bacterium]MDZ7287629.1 class I SAM-dependent methyltransferase [candidate division KSB1 bacterium]MDZ7306791.1 class I SAM-dependent methyltransferase [candidate division KSB1 bacterium]MDZ7350607.1 class I SAM-dependent methyltransferase [candidate division KSB1 bacterium]
MRFGRAAASAQDSGSLTNGAELPQSGNLLEPAAAYARWAATYPPAPHNLFMEMEQAAMLALLPGVRNKNCLDLACGSGRYLNILRQRGAAQVLGLDFSREMLAAASAHHHQLLQGDLRALPLAAESFDLVVCGLAVGHVENLHAVLAEIARVLRAGGELLYSDFHPFGALAGWRRTFHDRDGREYTVRHFMHGFADHVAACHAAGLQITVVHEPKIAVAHRWRGFPAVLVIRANKMRGENRG